MFNLSNFKITNLGNGGTFEPNNKKLITIGKHMLCEIVLPDDGKENIKDFHCEIAIDNFGRVSIKNLSKKPITVNGDQIKKQRPLIAPSVLRIGSSVLRWESKSKEETITVHSDGDKTPTSVKPILRQASYSLPSIEPNSILNVRRFQMKQRTRATMLMKTKSFDEYDGSDRKNSLLSGQGEIVLSKENISNIAPELAVVKSDAENEQSNLVMEPKMPNNDSDDPNPHTAIFDIDKDTNSINLNLGLQLHMSGTLKTSYFPTNTSPCASAYSKYGVQYFSPAQNSKLIKFNDANESSDSIYATPLSEPNTPIFSASLVTSCASLKSNDNSTINISDTTPKSSNSIKSMFLVDLTTPAKVTPPRKTTKTNSLLKSAIKNSLLKTPTSSVTTNKVFSETKLNASDNIRFDFKHVSKTSFHQSSINRSNRTAAIQKGPPLPLPATSTPTKTNPSRHISCHMQKGNPIMSPILTSARKQIHRNNKSFNNLSSTLKSNATVIAGKKASSEIDMNLSIETTTRKVDQDLSINELLNKIGNSDCEIVNDVKESCSYNENKEKSVENIDDQIKEDKISDIEKEEIFAENVEKTAVNISKDNDESKEKHIGSSEILKEKDLTVQIEDSILETALFNDKILFHDEEIKVDNIEIGSSDMKDKTVNISSDLNSSPLCNSLEDEYTENEINGEPYEGQMHTVMTVMDQIDDVTEQTNVDDIPSLLKDSEKDNVMNVEEYDDFTGLQQFADEHITNLVTDLVTISPADYEIECREANIISTENSNNPDVELCDTHISNEDSLTQTLRNSQTNTPEKITRESLSQRSLSIISIESYGNNLVQNDSSSTNEDIFDEEKPSDNTFILETTVDAVVVPDDYSDDMVDKPTGSTKQKSPLNSLSTPNIKGVKELMKTPYRMNLSNVIGVKELLNTPIRYELDDLVGVKELINTPASDDLTDVRGVKELMKTPKESETTPFFGIKHLMKTPASPGKIPDLRGVKALLQTPKDTNDLTDTKGVKELFKRPITDDLVNLTGVKELLNTPYRVELSNSLGVKELINTPIRDDMTDVIDVIEQLNRQGEPNINISIDNDNNLSNRKGVMELFKKVETNYITENIISEEPLVKSSVRNDTSNDPHPDNINNISGINELICSPNKNHHIDWDGEKELLNLTIEKNVISSDISKVTEPQIITESGIKDTIEEKVLNEIDNTNMRVLQHDAKGKIATVDVVSLNMQDDVHLQFENPETAISPENNIKNIAGIDELVYSSNKNDNLDKDDGKELINLTTEHCSISSNELKIPIAETEVNNTVNENLLEELENTLIGIPLQNITENKIVLADVETIKPTQSSSNLSDCQSLEHVSEQYLAEKKLLQIPNIGISITSSARTSHKRRLYSHDSTNKSFDRSKQDSPIISESNVDEIIYEENFGFLSPTSLIEKHNLSREARGLKRIFKSPDTSVSIPVLSLNDEKTPNASRNESNESPRSVGKPRRLLHPPSLDENMIIKSANTSTPLRKIAENPVVKSISSPSASKSRYGREIKPSLKLRQSEESPKTPSRSMIHTTIDETIETPKTTPKRRKLDSSCKKSVSTPVITRSLQQKPKDKRLDKNIDFSRETENVESLKKTLEELSEDTLTVDNLLLIDSNVKSADVNLDQAYINKDKMTDTNFARPKERTIDCTTDKPYQELNQHKDMNKVRSIQKSIKIITKNISVDEYNIIDHMKNSVENESKQITKQSPLHKTPKSRLRNKTKTMHRNVFDKDLGGNVEDLQNDNASIQDEVIVKPNSRPQMKRKNIEYHDLQGEKETNEIGKVELDDETSIRNKKSIPLVIDNSDITNKIKSDGPYTSFTEERVMKLDNTDSICDSKPPKKRAGRARVNNFIANLNDSPARNTRARSKPILQVINDNKSSTPLNTDANIKEDKSKQVKNKRNIRNTKHDDSYQKNLEVNNSVSTEFTKMKTVTESIIETKDGITKQVKKNKTNIRSQMHDNGDIDNLEGINSTEHESPIMKQSRKDDKENQKNIPKQIAKGKKNARGKTRPDNAEKTREANNSAQNEYPYLETLSTDINDANEGISKHVQKKKGKETLIRNVRINSTDNECPNINDSPNDNNDKEEVTPKQIAKNNKNVRNKKHDDVNNILVKDLIDSDDDKSVNEKTMDLEKVPLRRTRRTERAKVDDENKKEPSNIKNGREMLKRGRAKVTVDESNSNMATNSEHTKRAKVDDENKKEQSNIKNEKEILKRGREKVTVDESNSNIATNSEHTITKSNVVDEPLLSKLTKSKPTTRGRKNVKENSILSNSISITQDNENPQTEQIQINPVKTRRGRPKKVSHIENLHLSTSPNDKKTRVQKRKLSPVENNKPITEGTSTKSVKGRSGREKLNEKVIVHEKKNEEENIDEDTEKGKTHCKRTDGGGKNEQTDLPKRSKRVRFDRKYDKSTPDILNDKVDLQPMRILRSKKAK